MPVPDEPRRAAAVGAAVAALALAAPAHAQAPGVNAATWAERAIALGRDTARMARDYDGVVAEMRAHALALDPALPALCGGPLDLPGAGFIVVYLLGPAERLATVACDGAAALGNQRLVPYHLRVDGSGAARRLLVPARGEGRLTVDTTIGGPLRVSRARRTVTGTVRCCAGRQGTTTTYRVAADGTLALARVEEWTVDDAGRRRVRVAHPAPAGSGAP